MKRDSDVVVFKDKETNRIYCRICVLPIIERPSDTWALPNHFCNEWQCIGFNRPSRIKQPFFNNKIHEIIVSSNKCIVCNGQCDNSCKIYVQKFIVRIIEILKSEKCKWINEE